jgi:hypothetical protein
VDESKININRSEKNATRRIQWAVHIVQQDNKDAFKTNFSYLKDYLKVLACENEHNIICFSADEDGRFQRVFVLLGAQVRVAQFSKPHVSYDGGFLRIELWAGYTCIVCAGSDGEDRVIMSSPCHINHSNTCAYMH